jgi:hypothetical protein
VLFSPKIIYPEGQSFWTKAGTFDERIHPLLNNQKVINGHLFSLPNDKQKKDKNYGREDGFYITPNLIYAVIIWLLTNCKNDVIIVDKPPKSSKAVFMDGMNLTMMMKQFATINFDKSILQPSDNYGVNPLSVVYTVSPTTFKKIVLTGLTDKLDRDGIINRQIIQVKLPAINSNKIQSQSYAVIDKAINTTVNCLANISHFTTSLHSIEFLIDADNWYIMVYLPAIIIGLGLQYHTYIMCNFRGHYKRMPSIAWR